MAGRVCDPIIELCFDLILSTLTHSSLIRVEFGVPSPHYTKLYIIYSSVAISGTYRTYTITMSTEDKRRISFSCFERFKVNYITKKSSQNASVS